MGKRILNEVQSVSKPKLVESVEHEEGVLATVEGVFAEYAKTNKNGRNYGPDPWKLTMARDDVQRALKEKRMFGELDHPEDYLDIKIDKTALCITEMHMDEATGTICGQYKILDTPAGRILNTLVRFGSVLGVSSRASGDLDENNNVIPESYDFITFDVVTNPSNEGAFPRLVESVEVEDRESTIYQSILDSISSADKSQLKILEQMSLNFKEEMAANIINKIEERKSQLDEENNDVLGKIQEKVISIDAKLDVLLDLFNQRYGGSATPTNESVKTERTPTRVKASKPIVNESTGLRETTVVPVKRVVISEDTGVDNTERSVALIRAGKSK